MNTTKTIRLALGMTTLLVCGCTHQWALSPKDDFTSEANPSAVFDFTHCQAAAGARASATLYVDHFDGAKLNGLGADKLNLMMDADQGVPLIVHVAEARDGGLDARRADSVRNYLKEAGTEEKDFAVKIGRNPANVSPAAPNLKWLPRTESAGSAGTGADAAAPGAAPAGGAGDATLVK